MCSLLEGMLEKDKERNMLEHGFVMIGQWSIYGIYIYTYIYHIFMAYDINNGHDLPPCSGNSYRGR